MRKCEKYVEIEIGEDLLILKFAAADVEVKNRLGAEKIREIQGHGEALSALEAVMLELGWASEIGDE